MKPERVEAALGEIEKAVAAKDDEWAHHMEDKMREHVLRHIAQGGNDARRMAGLALKSGRLKFRRDCA